MIQNHPHRARFTAHPILPRSFAQWSLDLRLTWDNAAQYGWISGSAWDQDGGDVLELPQTDMGGDDFRDDIVALLRAIWADRAGA